MWRSRRAAGAADGLALTGLEDAATQADQAVEHARLRVAEARVQLVLAAGG